MNFISHKKYNNSNAVKIKSWDTLNLYYSETTADIIISRLLTYLPR